jgi:hypothetical protein
VTSRLAEIYAPLALALYTLKPERGRERERGAPHLEAVPRAVSRYSLSRPDAHVWRTSCRMSSVTRAFVSDQPSDSP